MVVSRVRIGPRRQQPLGNGQIVAVRRPQQRGDAVRPAGVDIDALIEQRPHGGGILPRRGAHEPQIGFGRGNSGQGRGQRQSACQHAACNRRPESSQSHTGPPCDSNQTGRAEHPRLWYSDQSPDQRFSRNASSPPGSGSR